LDRAHQCGGPGARLSYSAFMGGLQKAGIELDRKSLRKWLFTTDGFCACGQHGEVRGSRSDSVGDGKRESRGFEAPLGEGEILFDEGSRLEIERKALQSSRRSRTSLGWRSFGRLPGEKRSAHVGDETAG